ncbi:hypothetical protein SUGI_0335380 [Cryptomeria japonica]|nr:hypothetical protein SUGI_0335380 [Cryptomeria japonica]
MKGAEAEVEAPLLEMPLMRDIVVKRGLCSVGSVLRAGKGGRGYLKHGYAELYLHESNLGEAYAWISNYTNSFQK